MAFESIFQPLTFRNLTVKNRVFRSNVSGRFDNYDGSGNQARINWETKFARGGVAVGGGGGRVGTTRVGVGVTTLVGTGVGVSTVGTGVTVAPGIVVGVGVIGVGDEPGSVVGEAVGVTGSPACPTVICPFSGAVGIS